MKNGSNIPKRCERLKDLRKEKGYTQEKVAKSIDVTTKTYRTWEIGIYDGESGCQTYPLIDNKKLKKLSDLYKVSIDYLLGYSDCREVEDDYISKTTGLNDTAINTLKFLNKRNEYIDTLNFIMHDCDLICDFLSNLDLYLNNEYTTPLYYDSTTRQYIDCGYHTLHGNSVMFGKQMIDNKGNLGWAIQGVPTSILQSHALLQILNIISEKWKNNYKNKNQK